MKTSPHTFKVLLFLFCFFSIHISAQIKKPEVKNDWSVKSPFEHKLFIENKGQFDAKDLTKNEKGNSDIKFAYTNGSFQIYFSPTGITYRKDDYDTKIDRKSTRLNS